LNILRLALFQIIFLDRIPTSAAVNTAVDMAKAKSSPWIGSFVNGLLRNAVRNYTALPFPSSDTDPVRSLSVEKSFPEWLIKRWLRRFSLEETCLLCDAFNEIPPITLRVNNLRKPRETVLPLLENDAKKVLPTDISPDGIVLYGPRVSISKMTSFQNGLYQVQDEAAQLVSLFLNPRPGEAILDACAGLGGKTGHLAQLMKNRGKIIAADRSKKKLSALYLEMNRLGVHIVKTKMTDWLNQDKQNTNQTEAPLFNRILLDAPCSGLGVLRRNPDTKWSTSETTVLKNSARQLHFLQRLAPHLIPGGILVYAVCSTETEETDGVISEFLKTHPYFVIDSQHRPLLFEENAILGPDGCMRTFPHIHHMDGFFAVRLKRVTG
jgi:16S rRNA (cytosine967-C5)-methyltransferase